MTDLIQSESFVVKLRWISAISGMVNEKYHTRCPSVFSILNYFLKYNGIMMMLIFVTRGKMTDQAFKMTVTMIYVK